MIKCYVLVTFMATMPAPELGPGVGGIPMTKAECLKREAASAALNHPTQRQICRWVEWKSEDREPPAICER